MDTFDPIDDLWLQNAKKRYASAVIGAPGADRIPVDPMMLSHSTVFYGHTIREFYENPKLAAICLAHAQQHYDLLPVTKYYFAHPWLPELGINLKYMDLTAPVPTNIVVNDPEDAEKMEIPGAEQIRSGYTFNRLTMAMDYIKETMPNMFVPLAYVPEPVGAGAELCGLEQFFMWCQTEMDLAKKLVDIYVETATMGAEAIAKRYGMALLNTSAVLENSDSMSPEMIKDISPPALNKLVRNCLSKGAGPQIFYHFCGNHKDDYMLYPGKIVFTPLTIMQIGYWDRVEFPAEIMKDTFGNLCAIMPSVDTKLFVIENNQNEIYEHARSQIEGGIDTKCGMILGTTCEVPPYSYEYNIKSLVKAADDFGRYDVQKKETPIQLVAHN